MILFLLNDVCECICFYLVQITSKEIEVLLNEERIVITIDKTGLTYDLLVPYIINVTLAKCALDNNRKVRMSVYYNYVHC